MNPAFAGAGVSMTVDPNQPLHRTRAYRAISRAWKFPALIACSGGIDSTALVLLATEALRRKKIGDFSVCHVDHRSRPGSADEAAVVAELCSAAGVPFVATAIEDASSGSSGSKEARWREARYRALFRVARETGAHAVVTAHTRDDQVETVLLHGFSGSGWRAMQPVVHLPEYDPGIPVLRPLLDITRLELAAIVDAAGIRTVDDSTNQDTRFRRNAIRHLVIPAIESAMPGASEAILRSAQLREADADFADSAAEQLFPDIVRSISDGVLVISRQELVDAHLAVATRVILRAVRSLVGQDDQRELSRERVMSVLGAARTAQTGAVLELPYGVRVDVERERLIVRTVREEEQ